MRKWVVGKERKGEKEKGGGIIAWDLQEIHPSSRGKDYFCQTKHTSLIFCTKSVPKIGRASTQECSFAILSFISFGVIRPAALGKRKEKRLHDPKRERERSSWTCCLRPFPFYIRTPINSKVIISQCERVFTFSCDMERWRWPHGEIIKSRAPHS